MHRRRFLVTGAGALAATSLAGCIAPASRGRARVVAAAAAGAGSARAVATQGAPIDAAAFHAMRHWQATPQGRIAYVERGHGDVALFLHGFPLNGYQWRGALERLGDRRRCIAPDFLGLGYSDVAPGQAVTPGAQVAMLAAMLDTQAIAAVDIVANDSGGAIAQLFATRHPERVRSLLLTNCDVENDSPPPAVMPVIELARAGRFADEWLAPWLADKALARSAKGLGGLCYADPSHPDDAAIDTYLRPLVASPARKALTNAYAIGLAPNPLAGIEAALRRSRVPTRIVWGTGDTIFSAQSPDYLDRTLGASRGVRRVAGAKLFWPEEFPDLLAEEARALWSAAST